MPEKWRTQPTMQKWRLLNYVICKPDSPRCLCEHSSLAVAALPNSLLKCPKHQKPLNAQVHDGLFTVNSMDFILRMFDHHLECANTAQVPVSSTIPPVGYWGCVGAFEDPFAAGFFGCSFGFSCQGNPPELWNPPTMLAKQTKLEQHNGWLAQLFERYESPDKQTKRLLNTYILQRSQSGCGLSTKSQILQASLKRSGPSAKPDPQMFAKELGLACRHAKNQHVKTILPVSSSVYCLSLLRHEEEICGFRNRRLNTNKAQIYHERCPLCTSVCAKENQSVYQAGMWHSFNLGLKINPLFTVWRTLQVVRDRIEFQHQQLTCEYQRRPLQVVERMANRLSINYP